MRIRTAGDLSALALGRRLDLGWSQAEAAGRAGVSRKWVSDFERRKETVDLATVLRLFEALDIVLESVAPAAGAATPPADHFDLDDFLQGYADQ